MIEQIAIAVNGQIFATAEADSGGWFGVVLPERAFRDGTNEVDIFAIDRDSSGHTTLLRTEEGLSGYALEGQNVPDLATGEVHRLVRREVGNMGRLRNNDEDGTVVLAGWTADVEAGRLVDAILVFADGRLVHRARTEIDRPDVAKALEDGSLERSGFEILLPRKMLENSRKLRMIVTSNGIFSEIPYLTAAIEGLRRIRADVESSDGG